MYENVKDLYFKAHIKVSCIATNIKRLQCLKCSIIAINKPLSINILINTSRKQLLHKSYIINIH